MRYWNPDMELLPPRSIKELQNRKLRAMIRDRMSRHHPFYRGMFRSAGIDPCSISHSDDLIKLPFTTVENLTHTPDFFMLSSTDRFLEGLSLISMMEGLVYGAARGRHGQSNKGIGMNRPVMEIGHAIEPGRRVNLSGHDLKLFKELCGRSGLCCGMSPEDIFLNAHPYGRGLDFWHSYYMSSVSLGCSSFSPGHDVPSGPIMRPTIVSGSADRLLEMVDAPWCELKFDRVRKVLLATGDGCRDQQVKRSFGEAGISPEVLLSYPVVECRQSFYEYSPGSGFHTCPDVHLWECIDPDTGESVGPEERGELVFTSIEGRGSLFLRYRTGDIAEGGITYEPCQDCGRTVPRIIGPIRRTNGSVHEN